MKMRSLFLCVSAVALLFLVVASAELRTAPEDLEFEYGEDGIKLNVPSYSSLLAAGKIIPYTAAVESSSLRASGTQQQALASTVTGFYTYNYYYNNGCSGQAASIYQKPIGQCFTYYDNNFVIFSYYVSIYIFIN